MVSMGGEGSSEMNFSEIETVADSFDSSVIFHVIKEVLGFVLYMHQQIPSTLQDVGLEFDTLHAEYKELEMILTQTEVKASVRRTHASRMREVKQGIRRLEKLMTTISNLQTALQLMITEVPGIQGVALVLGGNSRRPLQVYELCFLHGKIASRGASNFTKSRPAEALSRKAIRALISKGAGSGTYPGPTKLLLLVKAPPSFNLPQHFLPKRDFRYCNKVVPFRLRFKCRTPSQEIDAPHNVSDSGSSISLTDSSQYDLIWFQYRHVIKGLVSKTAMSDE